MQSAPNYFPLFSSLAELTIGALGEIDLIQRMTQGLAKSSPLAPYGPGDDCAVFSPSPNAKQLLTVDSVTYGVHFDQSITPKQAGAKLLKRNVSDIASMGGAPRVALLNILTGDDLLLTWLEEFIHGLRIECEAYDLKIIGGDLSRLPRGQFSASLSLTGEIFSEPILRGTSNVGDHIFVTGDLGGSILEKHYAFTPRLAEGQWLVTTGFCTSMMDITDGIAKDLPSLLPQDLSATIESDQVPISEDANGCAQSSGRSPLQHALCDGEDYELLFTLSKEAALSDFQYSWQQQFPDTPVTRIGTVVRNMGAPIIDRNTEQPLDLFSGFEHF